MVSLQYLKKGMKFPVHERDVSQVKRNNTTPIVLFISVLLLTGLLLYPGNPGRVAAHSGDEVTSAWLLNTVTLDGNVTAGEWVDATELDLIAVDAANTLPAYLYLKNDDTHLYVAYDAVGDTTESNNDYASIGFDTGHDGVEADGEDDQFFQSTSTNPMSMLHPPANQAHFTYSDIILDWVGECNPFDPGLPDHAGLEGNMSFGTSPREPGTDHRTFEFRIPLALIAVSPGDTIGFIGGSQLRDGVRDNPTGDYSSWPKYFTADPTFAEYGNLLLSTSAMDLPPDVDVWQPGEGPGEAYKVGNPVTVIWSATDDYPMPADNVNITFGSSLTWTPINGDIYSHSNDGSEVWDTSGVAPGSYYVNVTAYDSIGQETYDWSNFTILLSSDNMPPEITNVNVNGASAPIYDLSNLPVTNLNATLNDGNTGNSQLKMANYTESAANWPGTNMTALDGSYDGPLEDVTAVISPPLRDGIFTYCVYGQDIFGNANITGDCVDVTVIDDIPPGITAAMLNGSQSLTITETTPSIILTATLDDGGTAGYSTIQNASFTVDGGPSAAMTPLTPLDFYVEDFEATVATSTLIVGNYDVCVYGADDKGNVNTTGKCATLNVVPTGIVDDEPPAIYSTSLLPSIVYISSLPPTVTLTAIIDDSATGGSTVGNANYTLGPFNWLSAVDMAASDGNYDEVNETVTASLSPPTNPGTFTYCVYAMDSWSPSNQNLTGRCVFLQVIDDSPPGTSSVLLDGSSSLQVDFGHSTQVLLSAVVSDEGRGDSNIGGANYTIGMDNWPSSVNMDASDGIFDEYLEDVEKGIDVSSWGLGSYSICVYGWDVLSNENLTGACASLDIVDGTPPSVTEVLIEDFAYVEFVEGHLNPVTLTALVNDSLTGNSDIAGANYTIGAGNWSSSVSMTAVDGLFNSPTEEVYASFTIATWPPGLYQICVYAWDEFGNANTTESCASLRILVDTPHQIALDITPEVLKEGETTTITATISDDVEVNDTTVGIQILDESGEEIANYTLATGVQKTGSEYSIERTFDTIGEYTATVWASDINGNWETTSASITVEASPEEADLTLWIILILVVVVIIVSLIAILARRRKVPEEELPEELPEPMPPSSEEEIEEEPPPPHS